jgi:hypothetical protein
MSKGSVKNIGFGIDGNNFEMMNKIMSGKNTVKSFNGKIKFMEVAKNVKSGITDIIIYYVDKNGKLLNTSWIISKVKPKLLRDENAKIGLTGDRTFNKGFATKF